MSMLLTSENNKEYNYESWMHFCFVYFSVLMIAPAFYSQNNGCKSFTKFLFYVSIFNFIVDFVINTLNTNDFINVKKIWI